MRVTAKVTEESVGPAEWQARCDLAALYRVVNLLGWTDVLETHLSLRVPGEPNAFLFNRYDLLFEEITASNLLKVNMEGELIGGEGLLNKAGTTIHTGVFTIRPDANCIMHSHTRAGAGASLLPDGLRPISQDALIIWDELAYHPYGEPATLEEFEALGRTCATGSCVILHNHGLLAFGPTVAGTLKRLYMMERACEVELISRQLNLDPLPVAADVIEKFGRHMKKIRPQANYGLTEWQAYLRKLERGGADYKR